MAILLVAATCPLWAQAAEPEGATAEGGAPATDGGSVAIRPEFRTLEGVSGWRVNGEVIELDQVKEQALRQYGPYVLEDMVLAIFLQKEAERLGVSVTEDETQAKVRELRAELGVRTEAGFYTYLRSRRITYAAFEEGARNYVLMEKVLGDKAKVSDAEVARFYQLRQNAYRRSESVTYRVIAAPTEAQAQAALEELSRGRSFEEVAKSMVSDPGMKTLAGRLQFYERGQHPPAPPEFEAAVFSAPLNQVVGPVKVQESYLLIRVEKKTDPHQFPLDEVREEIRSQLHKQRLEQVVAPQWYRLQLQSAEIEVIR
jgi:parvulin-like peptidyl-prolyl isomerase